MDKKVVLVFIYEDGSIKEYGGYFDSVEAAEAVCNAWNEQHEELDRFAGFINVTDECNDRFILEGRRRGDVS